MTESADERRVIHVRIDRALLRRVDVVAIQLDTDRARALQRVVEAGLPVVEESISR